MIRIIDNKDFILNTKNITYAFGVLPTGQLEHLYFGKYLCIPNGSEREMLSALSEKKVFISGNLSAYDREHDNISLEDMRLEMSSYGKGDIREPFVVVEHGDGSSTSDFIYESAEVLAEKPKAEILPVSYGNPKEVETLLVTLKDRQYHMTLKLYYSIFSDCDIITRRSVLINESLNYSRSNSCNR